MELLEVLYRLTFPYLYIKVFRAYLPVTPEMRGQEQELRYKISIWVRRGERDGEAAGKYFLLPLNEDDMAWLHNANKEAKQANEPGWFYCTRCQKAYPKEQYGYFYFAGKRCKQCLVDDPAWFREAQQERYN